MPIIAWFIAHGVALIRIIALVIMAAIAWVMSNQDISSWLFWVMLVVGAIVVLALFRVLGWVFAGLWRVIPWAAAILLAVVLLNGLWKAVPDSWGQRVQSFFGGGQTQQTQNEEEEQTPAVQDQAGSTPAAQPDETGTGPAAGTPETPGSGTGTEVKPPAASTVTTTTTTTTVTKTEVGEGGKPADDQPSHPVKKAGGMSLNELMRRAASQEALELSKRLSDQ